MMDKLAVGSTTRHADVKTKFGWSVVLPVLLSKPTVKGFTPPAWTASAYQPRGSWSDVSQGTWTCSAEVLR